MVKKIILGIVIFVTVGVTGGVSCLNYKFDNSVEKENVLNVSKLQDKISDTLEQEVNEIKDNINILAKENMTTVDKEIDTITEKEEKEEKQVNNEKLNITKTNVSNNDTKENKNTNEKIVTTNNTSTQEKADYNKIEEIPKKEENKTKEPIYNKTETDRMIECIDKYAKQNPDLIGKNDEKKYKIRVSKDAMQCDSFSPYRESEIEKKVANVFSCTFVIYAADINGVTKYYIGIE